MAAKKITSDDRLLLLGAVLDAVYQHERLEWILEDIGLPRQSWPDPGQNVQSCWRHVFKQLDNGALDPGYPVLIEVLLGLFPANGVFIALHRRYPVTAVAATAGRSAGDQASPAAGEPAGHVFISYVPEDSADVDRLQEALERAGLPVWRDKDELWPGGIWKAEIRKAITNGALVFLACFSRAGLALAKSDQNAEIALAIDESRLRRHGSTWMIPVRFDDCAVPDLDLGGGLLLSDIGPANLQPGRFDEGVTRLIKVIERALGR